MQDKITFKCGCSFPLNQNGGIDLKFDITQIPLDCPAVWKMLETGNSKGVFQLESNFGSTYCKKLKPENIDHLAALGAILRPGSSESFIDGKTVTQHYIDRKNGNEAVEYFHPALENALKNTYGLMIYQENCLQVAKDIAGFSETEADDLRKAIGKKLPELMAKVKTKFLEGCKNVGKVNEQEAEQIFDWIEKSQRYSFNASHAYSYAMNGYLTAYAKAHFPKQFFTAYLCYATEKPKPQKEINELVYNAKSMNIDVYTPSFIHLNKEFALIDDKIHFGLSNIKGVGESVINKLELILADIKVKLNKKHSELTWIEFLLLVAPRINSKALNAMICAGALSHFGLSRTRMWYEYNIFCQITDSSLKWIESNGTNYDTLSDILLAMTKLKVGRGQACSSKNVLNKIIDLQKSLENPPYPLDDLPSWIENIETELLGVPLTCSTIDECNLDAANSTLIDFLNETGSKSYLIACHVDTVKETKTKNGKNPGKLMAFISVSDITAKMDVVVFPEAWEQNRSLLIEGNNVMIGGQRGREKASFILNNVWPLSSKF